MNLSNLIKATNMNSEKLISERQTEQIRSPPSKKILLNKKSDFKKPTPQKPKKSKRNKSQMIKGSILNSIHRRLKNSNLTNLIDPKGFLNIRVNLRNLDSKIIKNHQMEEGERGNMIFDVLTAEINNLRERINFRKRQLLDTSNLESLIDFKLGQFEELVRKSHQKVGQLRVKNNESIKALLDLHTKLTKRDHNGFIN